MLMDSLGKTGWGGGWRGRQAVLAALTLAPSPADASADICWDALIKVTLTSLGDKPGSRAMLGCPAEDL